MEYWWNDGTLEKWNIGYLRPLLKKDREACWMFYSKYQIF